MEQICSSFCFLLLISSLFFFFIFLGFSVLSVDSVFVGLHLFDISFRNFYHNKFGGRALRSQISFFYFIFVMQNCPITYRAVWYHIVRCKRYYFDERDRPRGGHATSHWNPLFNTFIFHSIVFSPDPHRILLKS